MVKSTTRKHRQTQRLPAKILILGIIVAGSIIVCVLEIFLFTNFIPQYMSDDAIRRKFDCAGTSQDVRNTNIYCKLPDLYRIDSQNGATSK